MNKYFFFVAALLFSAFSTHSQFLPAKADSASIARYLDALNRKIDRAVVAKQVDTLEKYYAHDFVFTHGTGLVDSKRSWIKNVSGPGAQFISREHDSTAVEVHENLGVVTGKLMVSRKDKQAVARYGLKYFRIYVYRNNQWQLVTHRTTSEWHFK